MDEKEKIETAEEKEETEAGTENDEARLEDLSDKAESFEIIEADDERLKNMAEKNGCDVGGMISAIEQAAVDKRREALLARCGDEELIDHILSLEASVSHGARSDFDELKALFPEINEVSKLPASVVKASKLRGSTLLDEYLRYELRKKREAQAAAAARKRAAENSVGSQRNSSSNDIDPSSAEFIKAIWGR